jgi:uncharacterized membrane protein YphA (DoxX/SURF4 family)
VSVLRDPVVRRALSLLLGGVFVWASVEKIAFPAEFARIVYHYQLVGPSASIPPAVPNAFAVVLPWIELLAGLCLIAGVWTREAAALAGAMLVSFVVAVSAALARGIDVENCGCFTVGEAGRAAGAGLIVGDLGLLAVAVLLAAGPPRPAPLALPEAAPASR